MQTHHVSTLVISQPPLSKALFSWHDDAPYKKHKYYGSDTSRSCTSLLCHGQL